jgi:hypothetical protein
MSYIKQMFSTHPVDPSSDHSKAIEAITAVYSCAEACTACADACLGEEDPKEMRDCIRSCTDCADICIATGRILSRLTATNKEIAGAQLRACRTACEISAGICGAHGSHCEHCRICEEACRRSAAACKASLGE